MKVERREDFIRKMAENDIAASTLHHRSDTHSVFAASRAPLPNLDHFYSEFVHIPCGWWVTPEDRSRIIELVKQGW